MSSPEAAILEHAVTYGIDDVSRLQVARPLNFRNNLLFFFWCKHSEV